MFSSSSSLLFLFITGAGFGDISDDERGDDLLLSAIVLLLVLVFSLEVVVFGQELSVVIPLELGSRQALGADGDAVLFALDGDLALFAQSGNVVKVTEEHRRRQNLCRGRR